MSRFIDGDVWETTNGTLVTISHLPIGTSEYSYLQGTVEHNGETHTQTWAPNGRKSNPEKCGATHTQTDLDLIHLKTHLG